MIRRLLQLGWLAMVGLVAAGITGYLVISGSDEIPEHLLSALVAFGCSSLVFLCTLFYLLGMGRIVDRTVRGQGLPTRFAERHRVLRRKGRFWTLVGLLAVVAVSLTGYPTHLGRWEPRLHHLLFYGALLAVGLALWRLGPLVREEEELVQALGAEADDGGEAAAPPASMG